MQSITVRRRPLEYLVGNTTISILLFLAFSLSLSLPIAYTINGAVFALIGLFFLVQRVTQKRAIIEKSFIGKLPLFFMLFAVSGAAVDLWHNAALGSYELYIPFLWAPLIFFAVSESSVDRRIMWLGATAGALLAFLVAIYQLYRLGFVRPEGFTSSPITFGNNALLLGAIGAMGRHDPLRRIPNWLWYCLSMVGLLAGIAASFISQSRGGWLLIVLVLSLIVFADLAKSGTKFKVAVASMFFVFALSIYFHPPAKVVTRLDEAYSGLMGWLQTGKPVDTSIGPRLELWRFGLTTWSEKPWIGHGQAGLMERKNTLILEGKFDPMIGRFTALHNEFIQLLMQKGLVGFAGWFVMFAVSFGVFLRTSRHVSERVKYLGNAGLVVVIGSLIFGLTDMNLLLSVNRQLFVFLSMVVAALIIVERKRIHN